MNNQFLKTFAFPLHAFESVWHILQDGNSKVTRWEEYWDNNPNLFHQTNLHHMVSVQRLIHYFLGHISSQEHPTLNKEILLDGFMDHEDGEAVLQKDTLYHLKTSAGHLKELRAFNRRLVGDTHYKDRLRRAFLLQFAEDKKNNFPDEPSYQYLLDEVRKKYPIEAMIFSAIERWDYFLYAHWMYREHRDVVLMYHVLYNQKAHLDRYLRDIKGFEMFWSPEHSSVATAFLEHYSDIPPPKDEMGISRVKEAYQYAASKGYMTI